MVFPRSLFDPPLLRLRVEPDQPAEGPPAITEPRPRGSRRPHTDLTVAKVKHLFEHTAMSYHQIRATVAGSVRRTRRAPPAAWGGGEPAEGGNCASSASNSRRLPSVMCASWKTRRASMSSA